MAKLDENGTEAGRVEPVVANLVLALVELGITMDGLRKFDMRGGHCPRQPMPCRLNRRRSSPMNPDD